MEQWHAEDVSSESISIARCRELLGDEAKNLSDDDIARIRQHARAMADIIIETFLEQRGMQE
jgi:hypothetical protein